MKTRRHNALGAQILATAVVLTGCNSILDNTEGRLSTGGASGGTQTSIGGNASNAGGSSTGASTISLGGTSTIGGTTSAGGNAASGGTETFGGATGTTGGVNSVGDTSATGGAVGTAGTPATGGVVTTGGTSSTVSAQSTGGSPATGGTISIGGAPSMGGVSATGGALPTGGTSSTAGASCCTINSTLYSNGTPNPANTCQICNTATSATAWVQLSEGASCGTAEAGTVCHSATCQSGCWIASGYYAANAVNLANACQTCQPSFSTTAWSPLSEGASCGTAGDTVCHANACVVGCYIGSTYYVTNTINGANACQSCQPGSSTTGWTSWPEGASCGTRGDTVCHNDNCVAGCFIGSTYYGAGGTNGLCQSCQPTASTTAWTLNAAICGCTGAFETVQSSTALCVAKMVPITAPNAANNYSIDATEVTKGQYDVWLATNPALPASTDANCGYVTSYAEQNTNWLYTGTDAAHQPVVYVDWCDAYAYCNGVGARLCGAIEGGSTDYSSGYNDATKSQWYRACSSGGVNTYPYGNTYSGTACNGYDYWYDNSSTMQTVAVGSLANCLTSTSGYAGVYDLSGNVWEWEDRCKGTGQSASCGVNGGAYDNNVRAA